MYKKIIAIILLLVAFFPCNAFAKDKTIKEEVKYLSLNYFKPILNTPDKSEKNFNNLSEEKQRQLYKKHSEFISKKISELEKVEVSTPVSEYKEAMIVFNKVVLEGMILLQKEDLNHSDMILTVALSKAVGEALNELKYEFIDLTGELFLL